MSQLRIDVSDTLLLIAEFCGLIYNGRIEEQPMTYHKQNKDSREDNFKDSFLLLMAMITICIGFLLLDYMIEILFEYL